MSPFYEYNHFYPPHGRREDLAPDSAVSSFNVPHTYDNTLNTPVSSGQDSMSSSIFESKEMHKISSPTLSPTFEYIQVEDDQEDYSHEGYLPSMKLKDDPDILPISNSDNYTPEQSPIVQHTPFFGMYGVSESPASSRPLSLPNNSLTSITQRLNPGSTTFNTLPTRLPTPPVSSYSRQVPVLIAPSPAILQSNHQQGGAFYRSNSSRSLPPIATIPIPYPFGNSMPMRRKRRPSAKDAGDGVVLITDNFSAHDRLLLELTCDGPNKLPWKQAAAVFRQRTGLNMKVPALQMRKSRLLERLRVWTEADTIALVEAHKSKKNLKWSEVSQEMLNHGCARAWSKETVQKKWHEIEKKKNGHSRSRSRSQEDHRYSPYSDHGFAVIEHGLPQMMSPPSTVEDMRSRQGSDASSQFSLPSYPGQGQITFDQQNQRPGNPNSLGPYHYSGNP